MKPSIFEPLPTLADAGIKRPREAPTLGNLQAVLARVECELEQRLPTRKIAEWAGLSLFHFSREFRRVIGVSPHAYVMRRRLARAALLLAGTNLSIAVVGRAAGFKTHAHFTAAFRRQAGMTPRDYRARFGSQGDRPISPRGRRTLAGFAVFSATGYGTTNPAPPSPIQP